MVSRFKEMRTSKEHKGKPTMKAKRHHSKKIVMSKVLFHSVQKFLKDAEKSTNEAVKYLEIEADKAYQKIMKALSLKHTHKSSKTKVDPSNKGSSKDNQSTAEVVVVSEEILPEDKNSIEEVTVVSEEISSNEPLLEEITQDTQDGYSSYFYGGIALSGILVSAAGILYYSATHRDISSPVVGLAGNIIKAAVNKYNPFTNTMPKLTDLAAEIAKQAQDNDLELGNDLGKFQDAGMLLAMALNAKTDEELDSDAIDISEEVADAIAAGLIDQAENYYSSDDDDSEWEIVSIEDIRVDEATGIPIASFKAVGAYLENQETDDLMVYLEKVAAALEDGTYEVVDEEIGQESTRADSAIDIDFSDSDSSEKVEIIDLDDCDSDCAWSGNDIFYVKSDSSDDSEIINLDCYGKSYTADEQV